MSTSGGRYTGGVRLRGDIGRPHCHTLRKARLLGASTHDSSQAVKAVKQG